MSVATAHRQPWAAVRKLEEFQGRNVESRSSGRIALQRLRSTSTDESTL